MDDQTPVTWVDGVTALDDSTFNTEIRDAYNLLLRPPVCSVHRSSTQTIPASGVWTAVIWDSAVYDTEDSSTPMWSGVNPTRVTIQTPGWYYVNGAVGMNNPDTSLSWANLAARVNGTGYYNLGASLGPADKSLYIAAGTLISLNSGDYLELMARQSNASDMATVVLQTLPLFTVVRWRGL